MDKHDRPYRCQHESCAKLQGFTYSGGLLRHEREVHGKHGGPRAQLMCPYEDCKRHVGKGFTRKENLNEHIRRVHQSKEHVLQGVPQQQQDGIDVFPGAVAPPAEMETPGSDAVYDGRDDQSSPARKRMRTAVEAHNHQPHEQQQHEHQQPQIFSEEAEMLKLEVQQLRDVLAGRDSQIMQLELKMEEERLSRDEEIRRLQDALRQLEAQQQVQAQERKEQPQELQSELHA